MPALLSTPGNPVAGVVIPGGLTNLGRDPSLPASFAFVQEDGNLLVDFIGRFERIDADFQTICSRLGIYSSLPKLNVSKINPYQQYYNEETKELVRRAFELDISFFGYEFE